MKIHLAFKIFLLTRSVQNVEIIRRRQHNASGKSSSFVSVDFQIVLEFLFKHSRTIDDLRNFVELDSDEIYLIRFRSVENVDKSASLIFLPWIGETALHKPNTSKLGERKETNLCLALLEEN